MKAQRRSILFSVFLTAFLDLVGFSIIFPLFPQLLHHYLQLEGPDSAIGHLELALRGLAGGAGNQDFLVSVLFGGVLGSLYSVLQFAFAPVWGAASDRFGRRPTLLVTLTGSVLSYCGWFFAGSFATLMASRLFAGLMAGNLATVTAVVADTTAAEDRSKGMGIVGVAIGLGFIFGPAIGGMASLTDFTTVWPAGVRFGVNPFSGAALIAMLLAALNLGIAVLRFPETLPPEARGRTRGQRTANPLKLFRGINLPGVQRVNVVYFCYLTAFSAMEFTLTFLAVERLGYPPRNNAMMFVYSGLVIAAVQGGVVRRLAPRLGDKRCALAGLALLLPGFLAIGFSSSSLALYAGLTFMAFGSALINPCLGALISRYAPEEQQGLALGLFRSMGALSRAVGPLIGGVLYWRFGGISPYAAGALFLLLPVGLARALPQPPP